MECFSDSLNNSLAKSVIYFRACFFFRSRRKVLRFSLHVVLLGHGSRLGLCPPGPYLSSGLYRPRSQVAPMASAGHFLCRVSLHILYLGSGSGRTCLSICRLLIEKDMNVGAGAQDR